MQIKRSFNKIYLIFLLLLISVFCLSGCGSRGVSKQKIISDLQENESFSTHETEIEDLNIIKRMTSDSEDIIYVNVKGTNEIYSLSLNFKITYLMYNDGWHIETVEEQKDTVDGNYINEITPITGPSQDVINSFAEQYDWESVVSFDKWKKEDITYEITPTDEISFENFYGTAKYICTAVCEYSYVIETVEFPVTFNFSEIDRYYVWNNFGNEADLSKAKRTVELKPDICAKWACTGTYFKQKGIESQITIKEIASSSNDIKDTVVVDSYYFYDNGKVYEESGKMRLVTNIDYSTKKIKEIKLCWNDVKSNNIDTSRCSNLSFSKENIHQGNILQSDYQIEYYGPYGIPLGKIPILYNAIN